MAAAWLAVNVGPWGFGPSYLLNFGLFLSLQRSNAIFPLTWSLSVALFAVTLVTFARRGYLSPFRSFVVAGTLPFAAVSLFEIPYDLGTMLRYPSDGAWAFDLLSIGTWLAVGLTGVGWWRIDRRYVAFLAAFLGGFGLWFLLGFPTIDRATGVPLAVAWGFNLVLKVACFPLAGFPIWAELSERRRSGLAWAERSGVRSSPPRASTGTSDPSVGAEPERTFRA